MTEAITAASAHPFPTGTRGWLVPYLVDGDSVFGHGRLDWWCRAEVDGVLPDDPIPQITWRTASETTVREDLVGLSEEVAVKKYKGPPLSPHGAHQHLLGIVNKMGSGWEAMGYLVRWLAWGLAVGGTEAPRAYGGQTEEWDQLLYREFQLQRLQAADSDVLGHVLMERHGNGAWNPHAFFATPMNICEMMAQMVMHDLGEKLDNGRDSRLASVLDPCVGTGRMLLAASNRSVNLWGMDIDPLMVDACAINLALFAPWGVYIGPRQRALLGRLSPTLEGDQHMIAQGDAVRQGHGHEPLPVAASRETIIAPDDGPATRTIEAVYEFNRHGQGELFSVPSKSNEGRDE